ncbi:UDP-N-acetylmuramoyl-L-alanine--D-glutamate ligase [Flagellimonas zhangzhouensis]|uniref:UDP-N-acetylmuramoylalanine--D-glutamate ligase n=1 Tax=Flagellimonas zhangzhouensis TaxID=1073328 RepID=A0A1H2XAE9_9FLAO|nr:UDP-N-acetylmuramoyl-L-alanine--D-glutamate ligase [Allomuricauda zhangzhouensis]SDQ29944.1 UDP-N-acetylmuramoylalanine--D-glutamate ligase [Allomuricauda zhangzhouensis]SDW89785.1 UDP-N-acetylmuramoylalanine--D-glutamate ligase [Allomuricauda zhangzhouensis]
MGRLVILGGGESGVGTAILGKQKGFEVFVSDKGEIKEKYQKVLEHFEIEWESGEHTEAKILNADVVMKSPGIPDKVALVKALVEKGIPVISEIEFASKFTDVTIIGITGSNGKTTTTMLTHHLLKDGGLNVGMAGNIGDSYAKMVAEQDFDHYVLEISSFQLDGIVDFKPHIAILTNITPDHLDRYEYKFENYIASKFRIAMNQDENDYLIYDADDEVIVEWLKEHPVQSKLIPFSVQKKLEEGAWMEDNTIKIKLENKTLEMSRDILALEGQHNVKNTMAASMAAHLVRVRKETIRQSIQSFQGAAHRLEKVLKINHVEYINDSKATNVNATFYALDGIKKPIVWIVGGVDKGNDYSELMPLVREKVKAIICLGVDNSKLIEAFGNVVEPMVETYSMEEAVKVAYKVAERGDTVLLSPACASFDLFNNYEDRGDQFKTAVKNL